MKLRKWALVILLVLLPFGAAHAQGGPPQLVFTDEYVLGEGEQVNTNLVVVAQTITLAHGSHVEGDVALLGQTITVAGAVDGELAVIGDTVTLAASADVGGGVNLCADRINRSQVATIGGEYLPGCEDIGNLLEEVVPLAFDPSRWEWDRLEFDPANWEWSRISALDIEPPVLFTVQGRLVGNFVMSLVLGAIAGLYTLICPLRLRRVSDAALTSPFSTWGIGVLSMIVAAAVTGLTIMSLVLVITFCLLPILGVAWIVFGLMLLMGWTALSLPIGAWGLARLGMRRVSPLAAASIGAVAITFVTGLLSISLWTMPLYLLLMLLLSSWGLGAVVLTRFGGQMYPHPARLWEKKRKREMEMEDAPFEA